MNSKRRIELIDKIEKVARGRDVLARLDRLVTPWRPMGHMRSTSVALLLLVLAFTMRAQGASSSGPIVWSASFEFDNLVQWYYPSIVASGAVGGGEFDCGLPGVGGFFSVASQDVAHSGSWSDKLSITTPNASGGISCTRMYRWNESENPAYFATGLYYSLYLYIPKLYTVNGKFLFWNLFQFKDKHPCSAGACTDPFWWLIVRNRTPRTASPMYVDLVWASQVTIPGPFQGNGVGYKEYHPSVGLDLPVGQWIHFEFYLKQNTVTNGSNNYDGRLTIWQDGVQLYDMVNVETKYPDGVQGQDWSVNLYSDGLVPNPSVIYVDDLAESTAYIP